MAFGPNHHITQIKKREGKESIQNRKRSKSYPLEPPQRGGACKSAPPTKVLALFLPPTAPPTTDLPKSGKETVKSTKWEARVSRAPT